MTKKGRGLHPEEERLWKRVASTANPLEHRPAPSPPKPSLNKQKPTKPAVYAPPKFRIGERVDTAIVASKNARKEPVRMDKKTFSKMKRGKSAPEARIDLHGMTAAAAQTALTAFLLRSHDAGHRLVLVITGKGRGRDDHGPIPERVGVLRQQLPHWVSLPPLNRIVLQTTEAHRRHGGSGAFYVYLSRRR